jgi:predicted N-acetyltransferase YhbS
METDPTIRPMVAADLLQAQALTASFGWPHRMEDWALMLQLGRGLVAERQGRLVGTAMGWRYGADWATLGMIGVPVEMQGQGIGRRLLRAVMQDLTGRSLALHATQAGMSLYAAEGFAPAGSVVQHQGIAVASESAPLPRSMRLRPVTPADLPAIVALDRAACGMDRRHLLAALLERPEGVALETAEDDIGGFALLRRFGRGRVIGPLVAANREQAKAMIATLLGSFAGQFLRIDVPQEGELCDWLATAGLADAGKVIRMVRGANAPVEGSARTFGLVSQAFG